MVPDPAFLNTPRSLSLQSQFSAALEKVSVFHFSALPRHVPFSTRQKNSSFSRNPYRVLCRQATVARVLLQQKLPGPLCPLDRHVHRQAPLERCRLHETAASHAVRPHLAGRTLVFPTVAKHGTCMHQPVYFIMLIADLHNIFLHAITLMFIRSSVQVLLVGFSVSIFLNGGLVDYGNAERLALQDFTHWDCDTDMCCQVLVSDLSVMCLQRN